MPELIEAEPGHEEPPVASWSVLTGGPCTGKTTVANYLDFLGHGICEEPARKMLESGEIPAASLKSNPVYAQQKIGLRTLTEHRTLAETKQDDPYFVDGSPIDAVIMLRALGLEPPPMFYMGLKQALRYKRVFVFEPVEWVDDPVRPPRDIAERVHELTEDVYREFGYEPIWVERFSGEQVTSIEKRAGFLLEQSGLEVTNR
jgi:predicted ATPase